MEGTSPWGDLPDESSASSEGLEDAPKPVSITDGFSPMNAGVMLSGTTEMPTGVPSYINLAPPSSAAKVMGVLLIIWGLLQGLGLLGLIGEPIDPVTGETIEYPMAAKAVDGLSSVAGLVGFIAAGIMLRNYEKRGVWVGLSVIGAQFVLGLVSFQLGTPDGGLSTLMGDTGAFAAWAGISAFCSGFCALLVAIPMMVSNNGLE